MKKQKVLVFNLTPRSGMLHYSSQFCNELSKYADVKVVIASYHKSPLYEKCIEFFKIRTNPSALSFIFDTLMFWNHLILIYKIKKYKPDVVHFIDNHPWYVFYGWLMKKLWYKIYTTQHDTTPHSGENAGIQWKLLIKVNEVLRNVSDKLVVHWEVLKKDLMDNYWVEENKIYVVPHGAYTFFVRWKKNLEVKKNHFMFFGRIVKYKWLDLALKSFEFVKQKYPDFQMYIAGYWDLSPYQDLIDKYKDNIKIHNEDIPDEEVHKYFEWSEFVILPYYDATASGIIPVSYAFQKPVVVTNVGTLPNFVEDWVTGKISKSIDPKDIADQIIYMLDNKEKAIEMWKKWREYSDQNLGWEPIVKKLYF